MATERYQCVTERTRHAFSPCKTEEAAIQQARAISRTHGEAIDVLLVITPSIGFARQLPQLRVTPVGDVIESVHRGRRPIP